MKSTAVIILPAMGVAARFYQPLAEAMRVAGLEVKLYEQPGHGERQVKAGWGNNASYLTMVDEVTLQIQSLRKQGFGQVILFGHSLGGHISLALSAVHADLVDGIVLIASGTPWYGAMSGKLAKRAKWLTRLMPLMLNMLGYYPGDKLGFGGREFRGVMRDWLQLARYNRLRVAGLGDCEPLLQGFDKPVLSLGYECDTFGPLYSRQLLLDKLPSAQQTFVTLDGSRFQNKNSHFEFARQPDSVVEQLLIWLNKNGSNSKVKKMGF